MPWHWVQCTHPGCGRSYSSLSPVPGECPDDDHHFNLRQRARTDRLNTPVGKAAKRDRDQLDRETAAYKASGKGKPGGCGKNAALLLGLLGGVAWAATEAVKSALG